ncbi:hypothetical protein LPJ66_007959 [Kickxella alabastrina]|uniref:Uncharacterized protein n=1 Tax=Kickxella alabastrina TaxID=61397 RepID=A0ACC1IB29_9FUNG|nr:hypothetical protein LPJ66_007959 [Kickxella alabastrina]
MCIAFWTANTAGYDLALSFNRDEYYSRPTVGFHHWPSNPSIFAPQDLQPDNPDQRGSWIGTSKGRLALLTNFREPIFHHDNRISRGALIRNYLLDPPMTPGGQPLINPAGGVAQEYAQLIYEERANYDGFNLVLFDFAERPVRAVYVSNRSDQAVKDLEPGVVYGLSNSLLDNPWPKVTRGQQMFAEALRVGGSDDGVIARLMSVMRDEGDLQEGSLPHKIEDLKDRIFVPKVDDGLCGSMASGDYGTRTTDVLLLRGDVLTVAERNYSVDSSGGEVKISRVEV